MKMGVLGADMSLALVKAYLACMDDKMQRYSSKRMAYLLHKALSSEDRRGDLWIARGSQHACVWMLSVDWKLSGSYYDPSYSAILIRWWLVEKQWPPCRT
jgi:hypothetical protein